MANSIMIGSIMPNNYNNIYTNPNNPNNQNNPNNFYIITSIIMTQYTY